MLFQLSHALAFHRYGPRRGGERSRQAADERARHRPPAVCQSEWRRRGFRRDGHARRGAKRALVVSPAHDLPECVRTGSDAPSPAFELGSNDNLTLHIALRGVSLFRDDNGALRFDPIVAADALHGNGDGEVTLNELANLKIEEARRWGRYAEGGGPTPSSLQDYLYIFRLAEVVRFREDVACASSPGFGDPGPPQTADRIRALNRARYPTVPRPRKHRRPAREDARKVPADRRAWVRR